MAVTIIDGRGGSPQAGVSVDNRLLVVGSITSMPSFSVTANSAAVVKETAPSPGSADYIGGQYNGSIFGLRMDLGSYLLVAGSISSLPAISTSNASISKDTGPVTGSATFIAGQFNGSTAGIRMDTGSYVMVAGSISSIPNVTLNNIATVGSYTTQTITGSVTVTTGSLNVYGTLTATTGSEVYVKGGSILTYSGTNYINIPNTVAISGLVNQGTNPWIILGSTAITTTPLPVSGIININAGSNLIFGASGGTSMPLLVTSGTYGILRTDINSIPSWTGVGSVSISGTPVIIGSIAITTTPLAISGALGNVNGSFALTTGSVNVYGSLSATNPSVYAVSGIISNTGSLGLIGGHYNGSVWAFRLSNGSSLMTDTIGSIAIVTNPVPISGALTNLAGSFAITTTPIPVSGTSLLVSGAGIFTVLGSVALTNIGSVIQSTNPWIVSGNVLVSGTVTAIGSSRQAELPWYNEQYRGQFAFSGATLLTSGTVTNFYTPGAGSKVLLKSFSISTDTAMVTRLLFSGGTSTLINSFRLPASGTIAMNLIGAEPSGATNQPIGVGISAAGSVDVTVYVRDTL